MGIYAFIGRLKDRGKHFARLQGVLDLFLKAVEPNLFSPRQTLIWQGTNVKSLGGKIVKGPFEGAHVPSEKDLQTVYPSYTIEIEGFLMVKSGSKDLQVPSYIVASNHPARDTYGDLSLTCYAFHGMTFKNYFQGQDPDKTDNRSRLLTALSTFREQAGLVRRITVGDDVECVENPIIAMYHYQRDVTDFISELIDIPAKLVKEPVEGLLFSGNEPAELDEYFKPYKKRELVSWIDASESFKSNLESFIKSSGVPETGSILIYDPDFEKEAVTNLYDSILFNLRDFKEALDARALLRKRCIATAEKIDFRRKPSQERLNL